MFRLKKRRQMTAILAMALVFMLGACNTEMSFVVYKDNTYNMSATIIRSAAHSDKNACRDVGTVVGSSNSPKQVIKLTQLTKKGRSVCNLSFTDRQPIAKTRPPFVQIRRSGDYFYVKLEKDDSSTFKFSPDSKFKMTFTFPGPVEQVTSSTPYRVDNRVIIWNNPNVLREGFTLTARASTGISNQQMLLLLILGSLGFLIALTIFAAMMRHTRIGRTLWNWELSWLVPLGAAILGITLRCMDLCYRYWRRFKLQQRIRIAIRKARKEGSQATTSSIPISPVKTVVHKVSEEERARRRAARNKAEIEATCRRIDPLFFNEPRATTVTTDEE